VTIESTGTVSSSIAARTIVVRGAVRGDLTAEDAVHLEDGARVVGDVRAPRIAIAQGALLKGYVQTGDASAQRSGASRPKAVAAAPVRTAPVAARPAAARPAPAPPPRKVEKPAARPAPAPAKRPAVVTLSGAKAAPSPVVPALKKGAKGALAKKRG
jgi:hypothetical protein